MKFSHVCNFCQFHKFEKIDCTQTLKTDVNNMSGDKKYKNLSWQSALLGLTEKKQDDHNTTQPS
jgi:hypothetical protein